MHLQPGEPLSQTTFVPWSQMYDVPARFCKSVGFDSGSGFSGSESDNIDIVAVDGGGLEGDVDGCQQLARVLLTFFFGGMVCVCVCVCGRNGDGTSLYSIMLILQRLGSLQGRESSIGPKLPFSTRSCTYITVVDH